MRREGYIPFAVDLDLKGRQIHSLDATLVANVSKGTLRVESVPGAFVRLDNKDLGPVPQDATLDPGNHMIELHKSGFEPTKKSVLVIAGQRHLIKVDELATPPFTKSPAFWGLLGGGVALVGGAIVGFVVASNSEKTPGTGSLPPGRIYTGGVRF